MYKDLQAPLLELSSVTKDTVSNGIVAGVMFLLRLTRFAEGQLDPPGKANWRNALLYEANCMGSSQDAPGPYRAALPHQLGS